MGQLLRGSRGRAVINSPVCESVWESHSKYLHLPQGLALILLALNIYVPGLMVFETIVWINPVLRNGIIIQTSMIV